LLLALKIALLVALLITLLRFKVDLALAVLAITGLTIVLFRVDLGAVGQAAVGVLAAGSTWEMMIVIVLVQYIGGIQKNRNMFDHLIQSLNAFFRDKRLVAIVSPMIIGFLPMPGGALFSAPLVETSTREMKLKPAFNAFINYWFRHDWELIWPLYVGLLLFQKMSRLPMRTIILYQLPFSALHIITGLIVTFYVFRRLGIDRHGPETAIGKSPQMIGWFFSGTWPLLTIIVAFFAVKVPLHLAVIGVSILLTLVARVRWKEIPAFLFSRTIIRSSLMILAVLLFQEVIQISRAFDVLKTMPITPALVIVFIFLVSFTLGFLTGVNTAYIAIAFPILQSLIQGQPNYLYLALYIYVIGFAGILLSPLHLCLVLTNEFFEAPILEVYRYMAVPVAAMIVLSTFLVLVL